MAMNHRLLRPRASGGGFDPRSIAGLAAWWDASDSSTLFDALSGGSSVTADAAVAKWVDKSGNGLSATQATLNNRPLRKIGVQNGRDSVRFDGVNDSLRVPSITLNTHITALVVSSTTRAGTSLKFWLEHGPNISSSDGFFFNGTYAAAWAFSRDGDFHDGPATDNTDWIGSGWSLASLTYDGVGTIYKNNSFVSSSARFGTARSNSSFSAALNIGSRNQILLFLNGDIGEILIYNRALPQDELNAISQWINSRWELY